MMRRNSPSCPYQANTPRFLRGAALSAHGAFDESIACLRDALAGRLGAMTFRPYGFTRLAEALISQGQHGAVIAAVRERMEVQEETGALRWGAELSSCCR